MKESIRIVTYEGNTDVIIDIFEYRMTFRKNGDMGAGIQEAVKRAIKAANLGDKVELYTV